MFGRAAKLTGQVSRTAVAHAAHIGIVLEDVVFLALARLLAGLQRQKVADEVLELRPVLVGLAVTLEAPLDRPQVILKKLLLAFAVERHQDEVLDQVPAGEIEAARIHRLEDALGIVFPVLERDINDTQLAQAPAQRGDIGTEMADELFEQREGLKDQGRRVLRKRPVMEERQKGFRIPGFEQELVRRSPFWKALQR